MHSFNGCYLYKICIDLNNMTEKIVLTLTKHPLWGHVIQPVLVDENEYGTLSILEYADSKSTGFTQLNDLSKEIVLLSEQMSDSTLMTSFSKDKIKTIAVFHRKVTADMIEKTIRPYIENIHHQILGKLKDSELPLYIRDNVKTRNLYESNLAFIPEDFSKVIFRFRKDEEEVENPSIHYSIRVKFQEEELNLYSLPYFQLCSEPAALVINKNLLIFDDIDIKKLLPFFTKREIEIPGSYEATYIKTYIKNCLENYEVQSEGIDIQEIVPDKKAKLLLDANSENLPVLNLILNYAGNEFTLECSPDKMVQSVENDGKVTLTWFKIDKEWENELVNMLLSNGLEKTGPSYFSPKKNKKEFLVAKQIKNITDWVHQHASVIKNFEFNQELLT